MGDNLVAVRRRAQLVDNSMKKTVLKELIQGPGYEKCYATIPNGVKVLSVETKEGINSLKDFFEEMKDNDQLNYLNEILLFDSSTYEGISDRLIPGLEELYKEKMKDRVR